MNYYEVSIDHRLEIKTPSLWEGRNTVVGIQKESIRAPMHNVDRQRVRRKRNRRKRKAIDAY